MENKIPILEREGLNEEGIITAKEMFESRGISKLATDINTAVIFFDNNPSEEILKDSKEFFSFVAASSVLKQYIYKEKIVLAYSPLGGPAAGGLVEELIAFGVKRFIACGSSGLISDFPTDHFLLVTKAIRDEGLSYHYLEPSVFVDLDYNLNQEIESKLKGKNLKYIEGITWTTDAFYKETAKRMMIRKNQGAVAVEMECASIAAVCKFRNIPFSQILYFSDIVKQEGWSSFLDSRASIKEMINKVVLDIACDLKKI
ncbi:MAG: nucleoside phosphorylase [Candidatus Izemoplasmatales bacterium]